MTGRRTTGRPLPAAVVLLAVLASPAVPAVPAAARTAPATAAPADSLAAPAPTRWGVLPAPSDSTVAVFADRPRPGWEAALLVPYHVAGFPLRLVGWAGEAALSQLDELGVFDLPPAEYPGLPGPFGTVLMPTVSLESLEGFQYGVQATRPHLVGRDDLLHLVAHRSTRKARKLAGGALLHLGPGWELELGGGAEEIPAVRYYGLGWESDGGGLSYWRRGAAWGGLDLTRRLDDRHAVELRTYWSRVSAKESGYEVDRSLELVHAGAIPAGFPGRSSGWTVRLALRRDTTAEAARPQDGSFATAAVSWFTATDDPDLDYVAYHLDVERYLPLWHTKRTLALRGFFNRIGNQGASPVPFSRLVTFSTPDVLRGYRPLRYYGLGSLGATAEYRWPVWIARNRDGPGVDAYAFSDVGQVFMGTAEIAVEHLEPTGGLGLRLLGDEGRYVARFEVGFSDEEPIYRLQFSQTFQYGRRVLYRGKDPTRHR